jgi:hypothetical protein
VANEGAAGVIGLVKGDNPMIELSFDILSLEALFLVPRHVIRGACMVATGLTG